MIWIKLWNKSRMTGVEMKIKGAELIQFTSEAWPGDDWIWEPPFEDDPDPQETYDTGELWLTYAGSGNDPTDGEGQDIAKLIRKWRLSRTHETFTVLVPKERVAEIKAVLAGLDVKVQGGMIN